MRNSTHTIVKMLGVLAVLSLGGCKSAGKWGQPDGVEPQAEKATVLLGDPFIMLHQNVYYAYGTGAKEGIEVYLSDDLKHWKKQPQLALHQDDSWGGRWFWAPEVYYIPQKKKFFMYYSANEHICVATSDSPTGPFRQQVKAPMLAGEKSIDNSLFIDHDGTPYLYFDRFDGGLNIWVAQLEDDLQTLRRETLKPCIKTSQEWEKVWPTVNEGSFVVRHKGVYYMTYSGNSYESPFYGIGFATAPSPVGPWTKYERNPIFQKRYGLVGIGHSALFKDKKGRLRTVFHAHADRENIHPRGMYIADLSFDSSEELPVIRIGGRVISCMLAGE